MVCDTCDVNNFWPHVFLLNENGSQSKYGAE